MLKMAYKYKFISYTQCSSLTLHKADEQSNSYFIKINLEIPLVH